jgi:hypothetical protein
MSELSSLLYWKIVKAYLQRMQTAQDVICPCLWIASVLIYVFGL